MRLRSQRDYAQEAIPSRRYRSCMSGPDFHLLPLAFVAVAAPSAAAGAAKGSEADLWATVNACNPADAPGAVGIRGSMPGDGVATADVHSPPGPVPGPQGRVALLPRHGSATRASWRWARPSSARQGGQTFPVAPAGQTATLRGLATYQWRAADGTVVRQPSGSPPPATCRRRVRTPPASARRPASSEPTRTAAGRWR